MTRRDDARERETRATADDLSAYRALAELVGGAVLADPDGPLWRDQRFLDWLAASCRAGDRAARRMTDRQALAKGEALLARAQARRLGVATARGRPTVRPALAAGDSAPAKRVAPLIEIGVAAGVGRELWDEPVESWVVLPDAVGDGDFVALLVKGTSMTPLMHDGDTILVRRGAELKPETVIVARHPDDGYVCKRVERVGRSKVELASLELGRPPIVIPRDSSLVLGTVLLVWCTHRT